MIAELGLAALWLAAALAALQLLAGATGAAPGRRRARRAWSGLPRWSRARWRRSPSRALMLLFLRRPTCR